MFKKKVKPHVMVTMKKNEAEVEFNNVATNEIIEASMHILNVLGSDQPDIVPFISSLTVGELHDMVIKNKLSSELLKFYSKKNKIKKMLDSVGTDKDISFEDILKLLKAGIE